MSDIYEEVQAKSVEQYLNDVNYADLMGYVPSEFALTMVNLIKLIEGPELENKTPPVHLMMLDNFIAPGLDTINLCHRGIAKTTLVEYLIWYLAIFNELPDFGSVPYALYVSDSMDNGIKRMRKSIENRWHKSSFLKEYIPVIKITDARWEFQNKDGKILVVTGHGAKTGVRGTRENGSRPVLGLLDDLLSDDDARSPTVIESIEETVYNAIEFALHPERRKVIWNGTPFHAGDPLYKAVESGAWAVNVYPVAEKFPCRREEFKGSWEDRFTYDAISKTYRKMKALGKVDAFNQELMLRIMSDEDRVIDDADIQWYQRSDVLRNKSNFNFYITSDFATSEKTSADYSVISVWAVNNKGQYFWVDGICKRQLLDKSIDQLFTFAQVYNPISVGVEVTGQQAGFISWIQKEMMDRNIFFNLASEGNSGKPGIRPTTQKFQRFMTVVPWFKQRLFFFPKELEEDDTMVEAMDEIRLVAKGGFKSKHDDFIDTVSMLGCMSIWKPSEETVVKYDPDARIWGNFEEEPTDYMDSYLC